MADDPQTIDRGLADLVDLDAAPRTADEETKAEAYERRLREEQSAKFQVLKDEARAIFGMVDGRPGVKSPKEWQKRLEQAGDEIGNGRFVVRYLGAERYLDAATVAVLITLRQNLIADLQNPTTADIMKVDAAVVAYYNFLRVQGWIGNLSLIFESELFGQRSLIDMYGNADGSKLQDQLARLSEIILPLQDRAHRMMMRSLEGLPRPVGRRRKKSNNQPAPTVPNDQENAASQPLPVKGAGHAAG